MSPVYSLPHIRKSRLRRDSHFNTKPRNKRNPEIIPFWISVLSGFRVYTFLYRHISYVRDLISKTPHPSNRAYIPIQPSIYPYPTEHIPLSNRAYTPIQPSIYSYPTEYISLSNRVYIPIQPSIYPYPTEHISLSNRAYIPIQPSIYPYPTEDTSLSKRGYPPIQPRIAPYPREGGEGGQSCSNFLILLALALKTPLKRRPYYV